MSSFKDFSQMTSSARARAVEDFEYYANSVLGYGLDVDVCRIVQYAVSARRGLKVSCRQYVGLRKALASWLMLLGYEVIGFTADVGHHEVHTWLFGGDDPGDVAPFGARVVVDVTEDGVTSLSWTAELMEQAS